MEHSFIFLDVSLPVCAGSILIRLDNVSFLGQEQEVRTYLAFTGREGGPFFRAKRHCFCWLESPEITRSLPICSEK